MANAPDSISLGDMARGYFRGKLLCAAVRLGIADALGDREKPLDDLARETATDPDALKRVLRALASIGVVDEVAQDRFVLTPFGQPLRRDVPNSEWASIVFWSDLLSDAWTYLADCVRAGGRAGAAASRERHGLKSRWSIEADAQAIFHAVFAESTADSMAPIAAAHDFSRYRVVADLGGAGGALLAAILNANPRARGILVDRNEAIAGAAVKLNALGLAERCELIAGDLLEAVPPGADAYVLQSVLHGYDDDSARRILQNCRAVIGPGGRLLIIEVVLPTRVERADPAVEKMLMADLNMLAVTGGRERSEAEWRTLLAAAGYEPPRISSLPGQVASVIDSAPRD